MKKPLKQQLARSQAQTKYTLQIKDIKLLTLSRYKAVIFSVETNHKTHEYEAKIFSQFSSLNWKIEISSTSPYLSFYECINTQKGEKIGQVILSKDTSKILTIYTGFPTVKVCSFSFSITNASSSHSLTSPLPNIFLISQEESFERNTSIQRNDRKQSLSLESCISSGKSKAFLSEKQQDSQVSFDKQELKASKVLNGSIKYWEDEKQLFSQYSDGSTLSVKQLGMKPKII